MMIVSAPASASSPAGAVIGNPVVVGTGPGCSAHTVNVYRSRSSRCPNTWAAMDRSNATTSGRARATTRCRLSAVTSPPSHGTLEAMSVRIERDGPVWTVVLDRPEVRNAIDTEHAQALLAAFEAFDADGDAAVAVLWGAGGTFCAGADLRAVADGTLRVAPPGEGAPAL